MCATTNLRKDYVTVYLFVRSSSILTPRPQSFFSLFTVGGRYVVFIMFHTPVSRRSIRGCSYYPTQLPVYCRDNIDLFPRSQSGVTEFWFSITVGNGFPIRILVVKQRIIYDKLTVMFSRGLLLTAFHFNKIDQKRLYSDRHFRTLESSLAIAVLGCVWVGENPQYGI